MPFKSFAELFRVATGSPNPFPYQTKFAEASELTELKPVVKLLSKFDAYVNAPDFSAAVPSA